MSTPRKPGKPGVVGGTMSCMKRHDKALQPLSAEYTNQSPPPPPYHQKKRNRVPPYTCSGPRTPPGPLGHPFGTSLSAATGPGWRPPRRRSPGTASQTRSGCRPRGSTAWLCGRNTHGKRECLISTRRKEELVRKGGGSKGEVQPNQKKNPPKGARTRCSRAEWCSRGGHRSGGQNAESWRRRTT